MDFGKFNQVLNPNSNRQDIDLNIPSAEDLNLNTENEFSPHIHMNTSNDSQNYTENMNMLVGDNGDNEVHQSSAVDTTTAGSALLTNSAAGAASDDMRHLHPRYVASASFATAVIGRRTLGGRRRRRRRSGGGEVPCSDPRRFCTNYYCRTRKTPLWRKGPLGPKTLCNACGIHYIKQVTSRGSGLPAVPTDDDASPSAVPAETVEGI